MSAFTEALVQARQAAQEIAKDVLGEMMGGPPTPALAWLCWQEQEGSAILDSLTEWETQRVRHHFEAVFTAMVSK